MLFNRYSKNIRKIVSEQYEQHITQTLEELRSDPNAEFDRHGRQLISVSHDGAWANSSTSFSSTNGFNTGITNVNGQPKIINSGTKTKGYMIVVCVLCEMKFTKARFVIM